MQELLRSWREGLGMVHADNSAPGQSFTYTGQQQSVEMLSQPAMHRSQM